MTTTTSTATLTPSNGRIAVAFNGEVLGTVKDGGNIVRNAERILAATNVIRTEGYSPANGTLAAPAVRIAR